MTARKDDEIMAEYLLKGGKMLEKCCKTCGCPLFEYKKKTFCVVCAEHEAQAAETKSACHLPNLRTMTKRYMRGMNAPVAIQKRDRCLQMSLRVRFLYSASASVMRKIPKTARS